jgi:hypothetical protein
MRELLLQQLCAHNCHAGKGTNKNKGFQVRVSFEVFMAVTLKNGVFWDVTP